MTTTDAVHSEGPTPTRAMLILGLASLGAVLGFVLASIIALQLLGFELPDAHGLATVALVGGGWGWAVGALLGDLASSDARPLSASIRRRLRIAAVLAAAFGIVLVVGEAWLVAPNGLLAAELPWIRVATAADVIAGVATVLNASKPHQPISDRRTVHWLGWVAGAGFAFAGLLLCLLCVSAANVVLE